MAYNTMVKVNRFEQNKDPNYFESNSFYTNCGSYAFNLVRWYNPDEAFDQDDIELGYQLIEREGFNEEEVIQILFERDVEQILKDFNVTMVDNKNYPLAENEELIAFRIGINRDSFDDDALIIDQHFRVKRNGKWFEKCGCSGVHEVKDYNEKPWMISAELIYWGPIAYFVKKCF